MHARIRTTRPHMCLPCSGHLLAVVFRCILKLALPMQAAFLLATMISVGIGIGMGVYCLVWARTKRLLFIGDQSRLAVPFVAPPAGAM